MRRFARTGARTAAALIAAASLALAAGPASAAGKKKKAVPPITMTGTVYTFDNQDPIAGATVRVAELPGLSAVSDANGVYRLTIPGGTRFTPYADAAGHHRIYLQTWVSHGRDLRGVNFQMPTNDIYVLLAGITGAPLGPDGELVNCAVVSTFVNEAVRDLTFDQFVAFGAHGVAGATATAFPPLPKPIYFNESVIPDRNRTNSSVDGGVVWPIVPMGPYWFLGDHPTKRFAPFRATCEPGRVVNANPVQGLYELRPGELLDEEVDASTSVTVPGPGARRSRVKIQVRAQEYVKVTASFYLGKRLIRKRATRGWAPGRRKLPTNVPRRFLTAAHRIEIRVEDPEGNASTSEVGSSKVTNG